MISKTARALAGAALMLTWLSTGGHASQGAQPLTFVADLQGRFVAPAGVESGAMGKATAVLVGNRFTVHGSFSGLSSPLRDLKTKPDDPGVHLHRGAPGETTPYFHGLQVRLHADGRSGVFFGTATLDAAQLDLLLASRTYVDIHTVQHGPGEVRDQWRPVDPDAAAAWLSSLRAQGHVAVPPVTPALCHKS